MIMFLKSILETVSIVTGVQISDIVSKCRKEEVVQARKLFIKFAKYYGFSNNTLARVLKITTSGVRNLLAATSTKENGKLFAIYCYQIKKKLESNVLIHQIIKV